MTTAIHDMKGLGTTSPALQQTSRRNCFMRCPDDAGEKTHTLTAFPAQEPCDQMSFIGVDRSVFELPWPIKQEFSPMIRR
jgi:hypothetical protein